MQGGRILVIAIVWACIPPSGSPALGMQVAIPPLPRIAPAAPAARLTPEILDNSLALGRQFLLNAQRPNGSFVYEFDAEKGVDLRTRHAVREMGALWGIATFHRQNPTPETASAFIKAMKLQDGFAKHTPAGGRYLCEPGGREGSTNTVALYGLALQTFLAGEPEIAPALRAKYDKDLAATIKFLVSLRLNSGRFSSGYRCQDGRGSGTPSPYSDGEVLLLLARAAKDSGGDALRDTVLESAAVMYGTYVRTALRANPDHDDTKGFYQWGSLAFYELYTAGWPNTEAYAARTIAMARWMIDVHGVLDRSRNTGYAYEGLVVAWELARLTNDRKSQQHIAATIERGLSKLIGWQVGGPVRSTAVPQTFLRSKLALGGVVSAAGDPRLRVDMTQHQMHATLMVRYLMFQPDAAAADGG